MIKSSFMKVLEQELSLLSVVEREQILEEYDALFEIKSEEGLSEDEVILELGDPCEIAKQFLDELNIKQDIRSEEQISSQYKNTSNKNIGLFIAAIVFDVLLGFWMVFTIILLGFAFGLVALSLFIAMFAVLFTMIGAGGIVGLGESFILLGVSILSGLLAFLLIKITIKITIKHINWLRGLI